VPARPPPAAQRIQAGCRCWQAASSVARSCERRSLNWVKREPPPPMRPLGRLIQETDVLDATSIHAGRVRVAAWRPHTTLVGVCRPRPPPAARHTGCRSPRRRQEWAFRRRAGGDIWPPLEAHNSGVPSNSLVRSSASSSRFAERALLSLRLATFVTATRAQLTAIAAARAGQAACEPTVCVCLGEHGPQGQAQS
jgi:hypothetical protein